MPLEIDACPPHSFLSSNRAAEVLVLRLGRTEEGEAGWGAVTLRVSSFMPGLLPVQSLSPSQANEIAANWVVDSWNCCRCPGSPSQLQKPEESPPIFQLDGQPPPADAKPQPVQEDSGQ